MLLIILWAVSPVVLIPLTIHFLNKSNRYESHFNELFRLGRIDANEYFRIMRKMPPAFLRNGMPGIPPQQMPPQGVPNVPPQGAPVSQGMPQGMPQNMQPQPVPQTPVQPQPAPMPQPAPIPQPVPQFVQTPPPQGVPVQGMNPPPVQPVYQPAYQPAMHPPKEKVSSSSIMLTVGVILVSIAGLIFATALWASMGGGGRTGVIGAASLFFYVICSVSYKKLGLKNSSNAFYSLGAIFSLITYLTAGYYELFGAEFTFEGSHSWGFVGGGLVIVTALSALGNKLYKKTYLAITSLFGGFAAFMAFSYDISGEDISIFSMLSSVALAACLAVVIYIKGKPGWAADTLKVCAGLAAISAVNSPFLAHIGRWKAADFASGAILFVIISLYAFKHKSRPMLGLHSVYMLAVSLCMVAQVFYESDNDTGFFVSLFFVFMALGLVYRGFAALRTAVSDNVYSAALAIILIIMTSYSDESIMPVVCSLLFAGYMCIFALDSKLYSKAYGLLTPLTFVYTAVSLYLYVTYYLNTDCGAYVAAGLSAVYSLIALWLTALGKKPLKVDIRYISGSFAFFAAVCTVALGSVTVREETAQRLLCLAAAVFALIVTCRSRLQPSSAVPAFMCSVIMMQCGHSLVPNSLYAGQLIGLLMAYAAFVILSKLSFPKQLYTYTYKQHDTKLDPFMFGAAGAVMGLFGIADKYVGGFMDQKSFRLNTPTAIDYILPLLAWVSLTAMLMLMIREKNPASLNTVFAVGGSVASLGVSGRLITFISGFIDARYNIGVLVSACIVFVCLCILSRVIFSDSLYKNGNNLLLPDVFAVSALIALLRLYALSDNNYTEGLSQTELFIFWLAAGVYAFILIRKKNPDKLNIALKLISSGAWLIAFIERPFLVSEQDTVEIKVSVIAIAVFGFAAKYILRKNEKFAENFATAVHVFAMILLIGDALTNQSLINTLIVLTVAAAVMVISFIIKKKRWFLISAVMLVGLTIYICKDFLASISWWVYLLVIGVVLIAIAVSNEYFKNKNDQQGVPEKKGRFFEEWKW